MRPSHTGLLRQAARVRRIPAWSRRRLRELLLRGRVLAENVGRAGRPHSLIVLDDAFPSLMSPFRAVEYSVYLDRFPNSVVYTTCDAFGILGEQPGLATALARYSQIYPGHERRIGEFHPGRMLAGGLAYIVFVHNAWNFLPRIERDRLPFLLTLYPGGGFSLSDPGCLARLRRIMGSPYFRGVIVTQRITREYLLAHGLCACEQIHFIYGGIFPVQQLADRSSVKRRYPADKSTFDICFVGHKYTPRGEDKGYDVFVEAARRLAARHADVRFHVVGNFAPGDVELGNIAGRTAFHGRLHTEQFPAFYADKELILSPNAPNLLAPGAFDGFPTGTCIEAGACGVAAFCTDELGLNLYFQHGRDIVLIERDSAAIAAAVERYRADPDALYALARKGQQLFIEHFGHAAQIQPRLALIERWLAAGQGATRRYASA